jgi:glycosyltransferase involved in cell wall biosynthesis
MTLKEELEILRGEPIGVFTGDPMDIPCIETSDSGKLCNHPVVSVHMATYNHEPFIRQAIEGVMMQKTNFEFELVIGEDCSTDKTREICFEYQKKYPDKIRVLWSEKNLHLNPHPAGKNGRRTLVRCRGEFIAYCEGDDYWIDPLKLQKQVDVMRQHKNVGLCFGVADSLNETTGETVQGKPYDHALFVMAGREFNALRGCGKERGKARPFHENQIRTLTALCRTSVLRKVCADSDDVFSWKLYLGDFLMWMMLATVSDVAFIPDKVGVYRVHPGGMTSRKLAAVRMDSRVLIMYFNMTQGGMSLEEAVALPGNLDGVFFEFAESRTAFSQIRSAWAARKIGFWAKELKEYRSGLYWVLLNCGLLRRSRVDAIDGLPSGIRRAAKAVAKRR